MKAPPSRARPASKRSRRPPPPLPTLAAVAERLMTLGPPGESPRLWSRAELNRRLPPKERPQLDAALACLRDERQVLALNHGKSVVYIFAGPLRDWLITAVIKSAPAAEPDTLAETYRRLVRESGGFPDVKISALQAALDPAGATELGEKLIAHWRRGAATLSLGDWSLANAETRAAAVELDGERYLLVRFEEAD